MKIICNLTAFLLILTITICCYCCLTLANEQKSVDNSTNLFARDKLVPEKLFNFERFKSIFKKSYNSIREELVRKKIYFANALRAFASLFKYKHYMSTHYLKVNDMSDWTNKELKLIQLPKHVLSDNENEKKNDIENNDDNNNIDEGEQPMVELEDIESNLKEVVEKDKTSNQAGSKTKRDFITVDNLIDNNVLEQNEIDSENDNNPKPLDTKTLIEASEHKSSFSKYFHHLFDGASTPCFSDKPLKPKPGNKDNVIVDLRDTNCFLPPKHQRWCGCCYIFSVTALYEWQYCKETGELIPFSEQYALDCGTKRAELGGCRGDKGWRVGNFYGTYGVELGLEYPYRRKVETCPYDSNESPEKMGHIKVNQPQLKGISLEDFGKYVDRMPILIGMGISDDFSFYGGGVHMGGICTSGHSVLIIGHGIEDGIAYWLIRNSYGKHWGEGGYFKLAKSAKRCIWNEWGYVLDPAVGKPVFGGINPLNDGSVVKKLRSFHLTNILN